MVYQKKISASEMTYIVSSGALNSTHSLSLPKIQLNRLQHIQYSLARVVVAAPRSSDANQILKSLHWLKVPDRIEYKVISVTYKLLQSSAPHYLRDLITIQSARSTRSS